MSAKEVDLKIYWIPQVPMKAFERPVSSPQEAKKILELLADYDIFQFENKVKPDYSNSGGLQVFDGEDWVDWEDENGDNIDDAEFEDSAQ